MVDLAHRSRAPELMETEPASAAEIDRTLRDLATINRLTLARRPTLRWLDRVARHSGGQPLTILDVGCGHGDMLRAVWRWAERRSLPVRLTGLDVDAHVLSSARAATPAEAPIAYEQG